MVLQQEKEKVSLKHAPPGSACQNTLPSSNWVIFDTSPTTRCQCIDGEVLGCQEPARPPWHRIKAGTNTARRQSGKPKRAQAREHPKTRPHSSRLHHRGVIGTWAFRRIFKGGNLIHMCTMKLAILYPASPPLSRTLFLALPRLQLNPRLTPYNLFLPSPTTKCHSVLLSETAQGFDHGILGSEGGQGFLILAGCS